MKFLINRLFISQISVVLVLSIGTWLGQPSVTLGQSASVNQPAVAAPAANAEDAHGKNWIQLFNGQDLNDWTPKFCGFDVGENYKDTFRVEDGILKVCFDKWDSFDGQFGHLFFKTPYSRYRLRAEYRFVGDQVDGGPAWAVRNNGFMIHGQTPESMGKDQKFPNSIEVQLLGGNGTDERGTLNICSPGTHVVVDGKLVKKHVIAAGGPTFHGDDWVTIEIEVRGSDSIKHIANGKVVIEYTKPQLDNGTLLEEGTISIQAETAPCEFRKIELLDLSDEKK